MAPSGQKLHRVQLAAGQGSAAAGGADVGAARRYSDLPKPTPLKFRGVDNLAEMLLSFQKTSDMIFYEVRRRLPEARVSTRSSTQSTHLLSSPSFPPTHRLRPLAPAFCVPRILLHV